MRRIQSAVVKAVCSETGKFVGSSASAVHSSEARFDSSMLGVDPPVAVADRIQIEPLSGFVFIRSNQRFYKLAYSDIYYVEAKKNYSKVVTANNRGCLVLAPLNRFEAMLPAAYFRRIHRSYIVSLMHLQSFDTRTVYLTAAELPISARYCETLIRVLPIIGSPINVGRRKQELND